MIMEEKKKCDCKEKPKLDTIKDIANWVDRFDWTYKYGILSGEKRTESEDREP